MSFSSRLYQKLQEVPRGKVTTYKYLATALGTKAYQAVGQALKRNPNPPHIPCHRVVASDGTLGGFNGHRTGSELERKVQLLRIEGVEIQENKIANFSATVWKF